MAHRDLDYRHQTHHVGNLRIPCIVAYWEWFRTVLCAVKTEPWITGVIFSLWLQPGCFHPEIKTI